MFEYVPRESTRGISIIRVNDGNNNQIKYENGLASHLCTAIPASPCRSHHGSICRLIVRLLSSLLRSPISRVNRKLCTLVYLQQRNIKLTPTTPDLKTNFLKWMEASNKQGNNAAFSRQWSKLLMLLNRAEVTNYIKHLRSRIWS